LAGDDIGNCEKERFVWRYVLMFREHRDMATKIARHNSVRLLGRMKSKIYKRKLDTRDVLLTSILGEDRRIKKRED
jgi:hypothetical protein